MAAPSTEWTDTGSRAEFERIFLTHYGGVFSVLMRITGDRSRADELANEVFWRLYRQPAAATVWANAGPWLYRTATHLGIDSIRASSRRRSYERAAAIDPSAGAVSATGPLDSLLRAEECGRVRSALAGMKPARASILLLRANGLTYREIAISMNVALSGVGTLLNRAESEFRQRYLRLTGKKKNEEKS